VELQVDDVVKETFLTNTNDALNFEVNRWVEFKGPRSEIKLPEFLDVGIFCSW